MALVFRSLSIFFAAGVAGGLANAAFVWGSGAFGLSALMGVAIAPAWTPPWLYQRLVWGGIWGLAFVLPFFSRSVLARGLFMSLGPTAVQLLVVFPRVLDKGMFGMDLGAWTPAFVFLANAVWGVVAAWWVWMGTDARPSRGRL